MRTFEGPGAVSFHPRVLGLPMIVGVLLAACSGMGPTLTEAPDSETPAAPAVSAGMRDQTSAKVTWTAPATDESITGYELQWRSTTDTEWTPVTGIANSETSYTITGLQPETTYEVQVRALFATTAGAWSEPIEVSTTAPPPSPEPPPAADGARISWPTAGSNSTVTASSITVRWTAPATDATITGYELQWRSTTDTEWTPVTGIANSDTSHTISGLQPETTYEIQVRAVFATTAGAWSESITVSTTSDRLTLTLAKVTGDTITVAWVAPATARSITGYELQARGGSLSQWKTFTAPSTRTGVTLMGLAPDTTYRLRARARFGGVAGSWSATLTATTGPTGPPYIAFLCGNYCYKDKSSEADAAANGLSLPFAVVFYLTSENAPSKFRYSVSETGDMLESESKGEFEIDPPKETGSRVRLDLHHHVVDDDDVDEADSVVTVTLLPGTGYRLDAIKTTYAVTVTDDDDPPSLTVDDAAVTEGDSGTVNAAFTVRLSTASGRTVTVDWATSDGTAAAGADYTAGNGALTFAAGETEKTFDVAVTGDAVDEDDETFTVTLSNAGNASIADATATGTITDDDRRSARGVLRSLSQSPRLLPAHRLPRPAAYAAC